MQQKVERPADIAFLSQNQGDIVISVARMNGQRQAAELGGADMGAEARLLQVARRLVVEIIQP